MSTFARPAVVIHAAARVGGIGANRMHAGTFFRDNALMGIHVIEASRVSGKRGDRVVRSAAAAWTRVTRTRSSESTLGALPGATM